MCLAVKMTFVPVAGAIGAAALMRGWMGSPRNQRLTRRARTALAGLVPLVGATVLAYLVATAPIWGRLTLVWWRLFHRPDVVPRGAGFLADFWKAFGILIGANPLLVAVMGGAVLISGALALRGSRRPAAERGSSGEALGDEFDFTAGAVLLGVLALGFIYTTRLGDHTPDAEPGVRLRNISPTALLIPFTRWRIAPGGPNSCAGCSTSTVAAGRPRGRSPCGAGARCRPAPDVRQGLIHDRGQRIEATRHTSTDMADGPRRVAFWTAGTRISWVLCLGFHFWVTIRRRPLVRPLVLQESRGTPVLRLRNIQRLRPNQPPTHPPAAIWQARRPLTGASPELAPRRPGQLQRPWGAITVRPRESKSRSSRRRSGSCTEPPSTDPRGLRAGAVRNPRVRTERVADVEWLFLQLPWDSQKPARRSAAPEASTSARSPLP